jgi:hypothetical protein
MVKQVPNLSLELQKEDADWIELPIPEQFVATIQPNNTLSSRVSELYTH